MIKPIYALWNSYPISCLRLDSLQAGSFLLLLSPGPSRKRNLSTLQPTYEIFNHYVPDYHPSNKQPFTHSVLWSVLCMW
ncbi:hypothetical protein ATANTOWER_025941, partial [Ataeniobius toweri]|nr:hypothetical protein [Ataeniobius toweri]